MKFMKLMQFTPPYFKNKRYNLVIESCNATKLAKNFVKRKQNQNPEQQIIFFLNDFQWIGPAFSDD